MPARLRADLPSRELPEPRAAALMMDEPPAPTGSGAVAILHAEASAERVPGLAAVRSTDRWIGNVASSVVGGLLLVSMSWLVIGGIASGHSSLTSRPVIGILLLVGLVCLLGVYEGLQISVTLLRFRGLRTRRTTHARAALLHKLFRTEGGSHSFLAGRQLLVIIIVFFAARLTTFTTMATLPWTDFALPGRTGLFWTAGLDFGVFGALLVLWTGQLAPQFLANRNPAGFLNLPGMGSALRLAIWIDRLGLTRPGDWLVGWAPRHGTDPVAPREQNLEDVTGRSTTTIKRLDDVALMDALPEFDLYPGQVGTVVEILADGETLEVEFSDREGHAYESLGLRPDQVMVLHHDPPRKGAEAHVRPPSS